MRNIIYFLLFYVSLISACSQIYKLDLHSMPKNLDASGVAISLTPTPTPTPTPPPPPRKFITTTDDLLLTKDNAARKKIDLLFVIDISRSMIGADPLKTLEQERIALADGLKQISNTYFQNAGMDICTRITTHDRYHVGARIGLNTQREFNIGCTTPDLNPNTGAPFASQEEYLAYTNALILSMNTKIKTLPLDNGGNEMLGKTLATFLFGFNEILGADSPWKQMQGKSLSELNSPNSFFRRDSAWIINFMTDENNLKGTTELSDNDLPAFTGSTIFDGSNPDLRIGLKDYMDRYESLVRTDPAYQKLGYSIAVFQDTSMVMVCDPTNGNCEGTDLNLHEWVGKTGGDSIEKPIFETDYAASYKEILDAAIRKFDSVQILHEPAVPAEVSAKIQFKNGNPEKVLVNGVDFQVSGRTIILSAGILAVIQDGDHILVTYQYPE